MITQYENVNSYEKIHSDRSLAYIAFIISSRASIVWYKFGVVGKIS